MKGKLFLLLFAFSAIIFTGCSDDDDDYLPEEKFITALKSKYPEAKNLHWERKNEYQVADFIYHDRETDAWFDFSGKWVMSETDLLFDELPEPVKTNFAASPYANWHVDDVDLIERHNVDPIYIIEVEQGKEEVNLYYSAEGVLIKESKENIGTPHSPLVMPESIEKFIARKYVGAQILEYEKEKDRFEVDILDSGVYKDVYFTLEGEWLLTKWDIRLGDVPPMIRGVIESAYPDYKIDDVEMRETLQGFSFSFELEKGKEELYVLVDSEGRISPQYID